MPHLHKSKDKNYIQKQWKQEKSAVKYLKCWGGKSDYLRIPYPVKLSFIKEEIKTLSDKLKQSVSSRPVLQEMLIKVREKMIQIRNSDLRKEREPKKE